MAHDHAPALVALLYAAPLAIAGLAAVQRALPRATLDRGTAAASLLLYLAGAVHVGLVIGHLDEPALAVAFALAGAGQIALAGAAVLDVPRWRPAAAMLLAAVVSTYVAYALAAVEAVDALGIATALVEVGALVLVCLFPSSARGQRPSGRNPGGVSLP